MKICNIPAMAAALLLALLATACGSDSSFSIKGKIEGFGTGNLRLNYLDRGVVRSVASPAIDGAFQMEGTAAGPVLVRIYTNNGALVGRLIANKGDNIEATFSMTDRLAMTATGNDESQRLATWMQQNATILASGKAEDINQAVAIYVKGYPKRLSAGAIMADFYSYEGHREEALELIGTLADGVRRVCSLTGVADQLAPWKQPTDSLSLERFALLTPADTLQHFSPRQHHRTVVAWTDANARQSDSIVEFFARLAAEQPDVLIVDLSADPDTAAWRQSLHPARYAHLPDSVRNALMSPRLHRAWLPSAFNVHGLEHAAVASLPWFAVADSTGRLLYRGPSLPR